MPNSRFKDLPLEGLYELMFVAVKDLLEAMEKKDELELRAKKKNCEAICDAIVQLKKKEFDILARASINPYTNL